MIEGLLRDLLRQLVSAEDEQHADERRPLVLAYLRGTLLAERVGRARDVRQLHDRLVGILDRLLVLRVSDLARMAPTTTHFRRAANIPSPCRNAP
jgi:hypothetical protein